MGTDVQPISTEIRFQVGARCLWSAKRHLVPVGWSLADVLAEREAHLPELSSAADGFRFQSIPSALISPMLKSRLGLIASKPQHYPRHYINMSGGLNGYMAQFSSKTRATLARKSRKLAEAGGGALDIRTYHRPTQLDAFFAQALPLASRTYQARLLNASLPDDPTFKEESVALAEAGNLRAYILYLSGEPIAYLLLPVEDDVLVYAYLGYDPAQAHLSPGTVLQMQALEALFAEGRFRYFDFTEGDGAHKALFGTHQVQCATIFLLRRQLRNILLIRSQSVFNESVDVAGQLADRLGVKAAVRHMLRS